MSGYAWENRGERCAHCNALLYGRARRLEQRYCSHVCSARATAAKRQGVPSGKQGEPRPDTGGRLEDLLWMLDTGESPQMACHRLGVTSRTLARWLTRHKQHELARIFYNLDKARVAA